MTLKVDIVTQEEELLSEEADSLTLPTADGEITVLPGHEPLMSLVKAGEVVVRSGHHERRMIVSPGFVQVEQGRATLLVDSAVREEELSEAKALEAKRAAEAAMNDMLSESEVAMTLGTVERTLMELQALRRRQGRHQVGH